MTPVKICIGSNPGRFLAALHAGMQTLKTLNLLPPLEAGHPHFRPLHLRSSRNNPTPYASHRIIMTTTACVPHTHTHTHNVCRRAREVRALECTKDAVTAARQCKVFRPSVHEDWESRDLSGARQLELIIKSRRLDKRHSNLQRGRDSVQCAAAEQWKPY